MNTRIHEDQEKSSNDYKSSLSNLLSTIPIFAQRQDSVSNQLRDLILVANRIGMYDASDVIKQWCNNLLIVKCSP